MYGRIMCDLYLAGLYAAGISSDQIRDEFEVVPKSNRSTYFLHLQTPHKLLSLLRLFI
eukprot:jgi/Bigna1/65891/fgenesh1_kg.146_\